ncbi:MAG: M4 family metallopeptidase [Burkholderiales bacterium]
MKLIKRAPPKGKLAPTTKRAPIGKMTSGSGLVGFSIDSSEATSRKMLAAMARERPAVRGFAAGAALKLKHLGAETAALKHLDQAFESDTIKKFVRPKIDTEESDFKSLGSEVMPLVGTTVVKFTQRFNKIPVYGSFVTVELDKNNECLAINSTLGTPKGVKHLASVSPAQALQVAAKESGQPLRSLNQTPRLYYYFDQDRSKWCLAYIIEDVPLRRRKPKTQDAGDAPLKDYVIDAHTAKLIAALPRVATMAAFQETVKDALNRNRKITVEKVAGGIKQMHDSVLNVTTYGFNFKDPTTQSSQLPGKLYVNPPKPWPLEAIGAHANGETVASFLQNVVQRNNIDNRGGEMISTVNCWDQAEGTTPAKQWKNAYWNGKQMVYGQIKFPDGSFFSVASMLDVVGHEMFHGVTDYTARLEYRTEAGALNESYSDIFGIIVSNFSKPLDKWEWKIGIGFDGPGTALRSMADPTLYDQPKHMRDFVTATPPYTYERNDYGWVHSNSGIHNYAAYKIITARLNGKFLFTREQLAALFYITLTVQLSRTSQFSDSRRAMVQAARSLFRKQSEATLAAKVKAVEAGFDAVGIV